MFCGLGCLGYGMATAAGPAPTMSGETLRAKLGSPDLVILDVRVGSGWSRSDRKIKGAVRENPAQVADWLGKYDKEKTYILYCS